MTSTHGIAAMHSVLSIQSLSIDLNSRASSVDEVAHPTKMSGDEPKVLNPELVDALRDVAKQLREISEQLLPAVASIAESVKTKEESADDKAAKAIKINQAEAMEEELWETTRDTIKEQDQVEIDSWKDELNNLLVFAGLFSAVVTAFTVESYTWLQQDSGDATNMFLAYISLQVSPSPTYLPLINSSVPALPLQNVTSAFVPAAIAVPINTLWVLSLTLSLMSAFFAIAVQQWLRHLRLPADIPVRRAVELLALRADGLKTWQVPSIISLLPLLLQIAVILFLVGLFILLQSLNVTITIAFGVVVLLGLLAFLVSTFIPLLSFQCPYKSPLVPTVLIVLQWLSYPLAMITAAVVLPINTALMTSTGQSITESISQDVWHFFFWDFDDWCTKVLSAYIKSFGRHMLVDMGQFWLRREYQHLILTSDNLDAASELRQSSLTRVLLMRSHSSFVGLVSCMRCFSLDEWRGVFQAMVLHSLNIFLPELYFRDLVDEYGDVVPRAASCVRHRLSSRHFDFLRKAQKARDWKKDGKLSQEDHDGLVLSSEVEKYSSRGYTQHVKHLLHICDHQTTNEDVCWWREAVTPLLMLKAFDAGYFPEVDEARIVINFATKHGARDAVRRRPCDNNSHRMLFASCTAALVAMTHHPYVMILQDEGYQVLSTFYDILCGDEWKRKHKERLKAFYNGRPEDDLVRAFRPVPGIHVTLCRTLVELAGKRVLLRYPECPSIRLASTLREIYEGIDKEEINKARESLDELSWWIRKNRRSGRWPEVQEQQKAPVASEVDATPALPLPLHKSQDGSQLPGHSRLSSRGEVGEATDSQNFPSPDHADARRKRVVKNHEGLSTAFAHISMAEERGKSTENHADHAHALRSRTSGHRGIQRKQHALQTVTQPAATDGLVDPQDAIQVPSSSASDERESEVDNSPVLTQPARATASFLSQSPHGYQMLKVPHFFPMLSVPDDPSTLSAHLMPSQTGPPDAPASSSL
ncbi:hypothetical protein NM688_g7387 [Phlebia brevispora]|uniref:Uncharacterized protein n=1 Tax=Phlebia brevispora TaxID=194682 RepID=A0ACC1S5R1_9APHY|nr:hypothetical protein NM688_g7387 [Phlebia brevispora]